MVLLFCIIIIIIIIIMVMMMIMVITALSVCCSDLCCILRLLCKPINAEVTKHNGPTSHSVTADLSFGLFELIEAVFDQRHSTASLYGFHLPIENVLPEYTEVGSFVLPLSCIVNWLLITLFIHNTHLRSFSMSVVRHWSTNSLR